MTLDNFKAAYDNAYQDVFQKVLVGKSIANLRFESTLQYGGSVVRMSYDIANVYVRVVTRGSASTIDTVTDSTDTLTINQEYEAVFYLSDGEITQAGPLNPGEVIGGKIGHLVATDLDARILAEIVNANQTFDNGDLTTLVSDGVAFLLNSTTVPQMATRMPAKLRSANQILTNVVFVIDAYAASDLAQYLLGKQFDIVSYVFKNGDAGEQFAQAQVYISENLTGEVTLTCVGTISFANGNTLTINGVTLTFTTSAVAAAGEVSIGSTTTTTLTNLKTALETPDVSTAGVYYAHGSVSAAVLKGLKFDVSTTALIARIRARGGGRLTVSEAVTYGTINTPFIHAYYGKKGAIDVVVQDFKPVDMRATADRRGQNIFSSYLAGIKTYPDGAKKFLDVQIRTAS